MNTPPKPTRGNGWALAALLLAAATARSAEVTPAVTAEPRTVRLSESVRVTLSVEGDAPLRVEVPDAILDDESAAAWRARPDGPAAVADLPGHRQRWARTYRLDPYLPGKPLRLGFASARAFAGTDPQPKEVVWQPVDVTVMTEVTGASAAEARPPTGIEELPPVDAKADSWRKGVALGVAVVLAGVVGAWLLRKRRRPPPPSPEEWATARLDELAPDDPAFADRLSNALRRYVEARTPVPATRLTTAEVLADLAARDTLPTDRLAVVLERCDAVKFAARPLTPDDRDRLLAEARAVVTPKPADHRPRPPAARSD